MSLECKIIATHSGKFHCDEALACFMLKQLPEFAEHKIVRTRDGEVINKCDVVVDVGGVFDHGTRRYDHHQKEFGETMASLGLLPFTTRLSSAGLVYAHYGKRLITQLLRLNEEDKLVDVFFYRVYQSLIEEVDAVDNGIPAFDGVPRYQTGGGRSSLVGRFNPHWNEKEVDPDERFLKGMQAIGEEFLDTVHYLHKVWLPAREIVEKAVLARFEVDAGGRIILLQDSGGVPWKEHFFDLEEELGLQNSNIAYIIYGEGSDWRVQGIPKSRLSTFDQRLPLPKAWQGIREQILSEVSGIPDCVFVHANGFIGGNRTKEGALRMAREALHIGSSREVEEAAKHFEKTGEPEEKAQVKRLKLDE